MGGPLSQWLGLVFSSPGPGGMLSIAARTAIIYIFLILGLRLLGKRELGQMTIYDLVLIVVIANAVQNAMVGSDNSLVGGLVAALTLLVMNRVFTWLIVSHPTVREWMIGEPVLIVRDGYLLTDTMKKEGITRGHVMAAMREHGIGNLDDVQMAVLETDGSISIVPKEARTHRTKRRFRGLRVP